MPDHVHLVIARHPRPVKQIVGHLKARATMLLNELDINPLREFRNTAHRIPKPWVEGCWKVFLDSHEDILRAIAYVENNPIREGLKAQRWKLVTPYRR
jgi:REP element-mobilizing transposase RayT